MTACSVLYTMTEFPAREGRKCQTSFCFQVSVLQTSKVLVYRQQKVAHIRESACLSPYKCMGANVYNQIM